MNVTIRVPAGPNTRFAPGSFDMVGRELPIMGMPGGPIEAVVVGADVVEDGAAVLVTYEVSADAVRVLNVVRPADYSMGFVGGRLTFRPLPAVEEQGA